ncbi:HlyD family efflux transporter periplasmic adaptor subunit [Azospirillum sp. B21]|uniref:efflux RND transporter periplasmic adaptor subunit n=1 Tax=Azospirillum sp. B21 TaxID=2607496 RepID=UPI0011ED4E9E|nr:HlyD family efflux transporter periplasmic adaptor subunit [Azospirillum sp. B21]KAA0577890.1 HlyD family efflux transporter periplasmic adaptor subunit [Azospirillum sp. B21]
MSAVMAQTPPQQAAPQAAPQPVNGLLMLLELQRQAWRQATAPELRYHIVNQTRRLIAYRQAAFLTLADRGRPTLEAVSNIAVLEPNAPFAQWLEQAVRAVATGPQADTVHVVDPAALPADVRGAWGEWGPAQVLWCPLRKPEPQREPPPGASAESRDKAAPPLAGLWLGRDEPWTDGEILLLSHLAEGYGHAWWALSGKRAKRRGLRRVLLPLLVLLTLAGALAIPVPMSTLAPAEIQTSNPVIVAAPLDGVIERFHVQPNQAVAAGQPLFSFDSTVLRSRFEVARKGLTQAEAELLTASQAAFADPQTKARVAQLRAQVELRRAELALARDLLDRVTVKAERAGIAVFTDVNDWLGKPLSVGERVLTLADPQAPEIDIMVPVGDALVLEPGSPVELFLNVDPLHPLRARLTHASYEAGLSAAGVLSYRVKAALEPGQSPGDAPPRIGLRGTAKILGDRVPLALYLFRRPLALLRQSLGI